MAQVKLYMWGVPLVAGRHSGVLFDGKVVYNDHEVHIPATSLDRTFIEALSGLVARAAGEQPALKVPSSRECGWCKITAEDCPERVAGEVSVGVTELF